MAKQKDQHCPVVLAIAGYDPSSGAGITADIKTIAAHGCYGITCITALTVQSTRGVRRVDPVEARIIAETLEELAADIDIAAVKIGMLGSAEAARAVSAFLKRHHLNHVVLDPIIRSSSGAELIEKRALEILRDRMIPQATVLTPNIEEAAALSRMELTDLDQISLAAESLQGMGARNVVITGGHLTSPVDLVLPYRGKPVLIEGQRIATNSTHGTGCVFSSSMACSLARGKTVVEAARAAKSFVEASLRKAPQIGSGTGPVI